MGDFLSLSFLSLCNPRKLAATPSQVCKGRYWVLWGLTQEYNLNWKLWRNLRNASSTFFFSRDWRTSKQILVNTEGQNDLIFSLNFWMSGSTELGACGGAGCVFLLMECTAQVNAVNWHWEKLITGVEGVWYEDIGACLGGLWVWPCEGRGLPRERGKDYWWAKCKSIPTVPWLAAAPGQARGVMWEWGGRGQQAGPATSLGEWVLGRKDRGESRAAAAAVAAAELWGGGSPRPGAGAAPGPFPRPAARPIGRRWQLWRGNGDLG